MVKPKWYSGGSRGGHPTRRLIVRVEGPKKIFGVSPTPPPPPSQGLDDRFPPLLACSRLRDSGKKSFSKKKCEKRAGAGERQGHFFPIFLAATAPFLKSRASYFRFARFNTSALCYLRAWHRLLPYLKLLIRHCDVKAISNPFPLICLYAKVTKIHTVLFATVN